jgi:hypothetical protein
MDELGKMTGLQLLAAGMETLGENFYKHKKGVERRVDQACLASSSAPLIRTSISEKVR